MTKTIGVLGGMGPYATLDFLRTLYDLTDTDKDWDHFRVLVDSNPKIPSRTRAYLFSEADPVPMMKESIKSLIAAGADFIVLPCNSAHYFISNALENVNVPFIDMVRATSKEIIARGYESIGVLAGEVTVGAGLYEKTLNPAGVSVIQVNDEEQKMVRKIIENVKKNQITAATEKLLLNLYSLLEDKGANAIILGCTELQAVSRLVKYNLPIVDSLEILALETITEARRTA